ncbi:MAG: hypothetical protein JXA68_03570 [Ignavibacteriales bacterium]|nr:hypothetical protein [Ignavibacteriales bacterium]
MKKLSLIMAIFIITSLGFIIQADNKPKKQDGIIKKLNLSEEQLQKFNDLQFDLENQLLELKYAVDKNRIEIKNSIRQMPIDKNTILALTNKNNEIQAQRKLLIVENWFIVYDILNEEQQKIWVNHFEQMEKPKLSNKKNKIENFNKNKPPKR